MVHICEWFRLSFFFLLSIHIRAARVTCVSVFDCPQSYLDLYLPTCVLLLLKGLFISDVFFAFYARIGYVSMRRVWVSLCVCICMCVFSHYNIPLIVFWYVLTFMYLSPENDSKKKRKVNTWNEKWCQKNPGYMVLAFN